MNVFSLVKTEKSVKDDDKSFQSPKKTGLKSLLSSPSKASPSPLRRLGSLFSKKPKTTDADVKNANGDQSNEKK